ncbi:MAG: hypothetical protein JWM05_1972 [Acidimicrobiales bacterium]|nr:hypothetical protein [Acidimicrobiales bacterium]
MPAEPPNDPALDPDRIAGRSFTRTRKGFDADEVRAYLVALSSELRQSQNDRADLELRLAEAERRATDPRELDPHDLTVLLGEETSRVLEAARQAATDIRSKAEEAAARLVQEASDEATASRTAADEYAARTRGDADAETSAQRSAADEYARATRQSADDDTAALRAAADSYDHEVRSTADADVAQLHERTATEVGRLRADADSILSERTAEAEEAANEIQAEAEALRARVDAEVLELRDAARAETDSLRAAVEGEVAALRSDAAAEVAVLREEARAEVDALRITTEAELRVRREESAADALAEVDDAREQGRAMVEEARSYRERVLADLADRRRAARSQLEQVRDTRDGLLDALGAVSEQVIDAERRLADVLPNPPSAGDGSIDRAALGAAGLSDAGEAESGSESGPAPEPSGDDTLDADGATIDALFARIRADRSDNVARAHEFLGDEAPVDEPAPVAEAAPEVVEAAVITEEAAPAAEEEPAPEAEAEPEPDADVVLLERRDAATDEIERQLARRLKRVLSDEQNEVLDLLRRTRGAPKAADALPAAEAHAMRYGAAVAEDLDAAAAAGVLFFGAEAGRSVKVGDLADELASEVVRQIRTRLERAFEDGGDEAEVGDRIRSCYREWKTQRIADTSRHFVIAAFTRGVSAALPDGSRARWLVDDGDAPCPDCDDNALGGAVATGDAFPTGDLMPPAHPGCRCLLVPVEP